MDFLPIFLDIRDKSCVIVGGGDIAHRKASLLLRAGAKLHIIAEVISSELNAFCVEHEIVTSQKSFSATDLKKAILVVAATNNPGTNKQVSEAATSTNIPVNVVDQPELCTFIMPSIVDRSPVIVAISSGGHSPVLSRKLKELNEIMLPARVGKLATLLGSYRKQVKRKINDFPQRIRFWETILDGKVPELVYSGNESDAIAELEKQLKRQLKDSQNKDYAGEVYLVGAGPGDPDLLTLRALRLMHKADVVLYDRLVSEEILLKLRPDAEKIYVGKQSANHALGQESINEMLVRLAGEGHKVLRLKGGDPFIFGRGGEELETLAEAGVSFQIVPGITAASGCASYAGIPLTHRDYSQSVRFLTGHTKEGSVPLQWEILAKEQQTLVFYMGLAGLPTICTQLVKHGMSSSTPVAVVQQGTTSMQKVVVADLKSIAELATANKIKAPTIIIVGEVVRLHGMLAWFRK